MVKTAAFISSSAAYVRATVAKANADKNTYLTKAESAALPADLQDNFGNHRVGAQKNGRVVADKFVERYTAYVAVKAKEADANGNGILSKKEAKNLPVDLQDNFANFRSA